MDRNRVAIVIPAFNEAATIQEVIKGVFNYGIPIVVDDGSSDDTALIASSSGAIVVSHINNLGYDCALNSGFKKANELGAKVIISFDADGQHNSAYITSFIKAFTNGADLVVGKRSKFQRHAEYLFSYYSRFRFRIADPLCGMKGYSIGLYKSLGFIDSYKSIGTQLAFYAAKNHFCIKQISIETKTRKDNSRFGRSIRGNLIILNSLIKSLWKI
jgi:glycosyltransferase involved in cell wall biosynthesis